MSGSHMGCFRKKSSARLDLYHHFGDFGHHFDSFGRPWGDFYRFLRVPKKGWNLEAPGQDQESQAPWAPRVINKVSGAQY